MSGIRSSGLRALASIGLAVGAVACQPLAPTTQSATVEPHPGLTLAQTSCGGCHAVGQRSVSPNPEAPPFAAIVNQEGLTGNTLAAWLRNAHNYPAEMKFTLERRQVDALVGYMLTLRDPNYRPGI
jgi:mono/diheme cytochrome c family protein